MVRGHTYRYLSNVLAWPRLPGDIHPEGWFRNFSEADQMLASALLDSFIYITDRELRQAIAASLKSLSADELHDRQRTGTVDEAWKRRLERIVISVPLGQSHDITSSGVACLRILKEMGVADSRLLVGEPLYDAIRTAKAPIELVLIDDLAATGNQFTRFWNSTQAFGRSSKISPAQIVADGAISSAVYLPVVATTVAVSKIKDQASHVSLRPANIIGPEYLISTDKCNLFPQDQLQSVRELIVTHTERTGSKHGPFGYGELGLTLSFSHGTPNNTIPILGPRPPEFPTANWTYLRSN